MGKILCATRGGETSRRTQDEAINLALEQGDQLVFLYVVDTALVDNTYAPVVVDVASELQHMGDTLLAVAQEHARERGVEAQVISRRGDTREEIKAAATEEGIDIVVLGRPSGEGERDFFEESALQKFADEIQAETGAKVVIV